MEIFTNLDLRDGFHEIAIHSYDSNYFAFATPTSQYEYVKKPFGFSEAPAEFQKRVLQIFAPLIKIDKVLIYMNDLSPCFVWERYWRQSQRGKVDTLDEAVKMIITLYAKWGYG